MGWSTFWASLELWDFFTPSTHLHLFPAHHLQPQGGIKLWQSLDFLESRVELCLCCFIADDSCVSFLTSSSICSPLRRMNYYHVFGHDYCHDQPRANRLCRAENYWGCAPLVLPIRVINWAVICGRFVEGEFLTEGEGWHLRETVRTSMPFTFNAVVTPTFFFFISQ